MLALNSSVIEWEVPQVFGDVLAVSEKFILSLKARHGGLIIRCFVSDVVAGSVRVLLVIKWEILVVLGKQSGCFMIIK